MGNPLRERMAGGECVIGAILTVPSPEIAAQIAAVGFDFLWIEMEHAPVTLESLRTVILATRGLPALPIVRVPVTELWTAKRVLDAGSIGVVFPFVNTPALARTAADACRYPPKGLRGSGAGLANFRWPVADYCDFADEDVLCIGMIESAEAVERIDEIAATPGLDVLFLGPSDLSFSYGLRGRQDEPVLRGAIARVAASARRHGKFLGRQAADGDDAEKCRAEGFQFLLGPTDVEMLRQGAGRLLEPLGRFRPPGAGTLV